MAGLLEYFDHLYVINLASRTDRRDEMQSQLKRIGLSLDDSQVTLFEAIRPDGPGDFPSIGARGCFMSHLGVLRLAERAGHERILVFEDDLDFADDFTERWPHLQEILSRESWSIFYGTYEALPNGPPPGTGLLRVMPSAEGLVNLQFVGYRRMTIVPLVGYLDAMLKRPAGHMAGGPMHVDGALSWFRAQHPDQVTLIAAPQLGYERPSRTDIHAIGWYDRWPLVSSVAQLLRRWHWRWVRKPNL